LRFVGSLVVGGCEPGMLGKLLKDLEKPYSYRGDEIYYDWNQRRWRLLPKPPSEEVDFDYWSWIQQLKDEGDLETLKDLAEDVVNALAELADSKLEGESK
jgi:hypothetical protein